MNALTSRLLSSNVVCASLLLLLLLLSCSLALPLAATTIAPPANLGELARMSQSVVFARAGESWVDPKGYLPHTVTRFEVLQQLSGESVPFVIEVAEPGGTIDGDGAVVSGAAAFHAERNYLLFLDRKADGRWMSKMMSFGVLEEVPGKGLLRPIPESEELAPAHGLAKHGIEPIETYRKDALLNLLPQLSLGMRWDRRLVAAAPLLAPEAEDVNPNQPAACYFLGQDASTRAGTPYRWRFENGTVATVRTTAPGQTGIADGGVSAVQQATAAWTNHPDSTINFAYGGSTARTIACGGTFDVQSGAVVFDDPCSDIANLSGCSGILAQGGTFGSGTHTYDGGTWNTASSPFVVVNNGVSCIGATAFTEMITHELGHSLGFGHHTAASAPNNPTMSAFLKNDGRGAAVVASDRSCASYAYHTFLDIPYSHFSWKWIEAIENAGIIPGCGGNNFCPNTVVTRDSMAGFLLRAKHGGSYTPPSCSSAVFNDVPCNHPSAAWINQLAAEGITNGCGPGTYCPNTEVNRITMSIFILRTIEGPAYQPPACITPAFADVPCSNPFAGWANELAARGITNGCDASNFCPNQVVNRAQMAIFLQRALNLPLPTPTP